MSNQIVYLKKHPSKPHLALISCPKCHTDQTILPPRRPETHYCAKCFEIMLVSPKSKEPS